MEPLKFTPILKEKIWGGQSLAKKMKRSDLIDRPIGECWSFSVHPEGNCRIASGIYKGHTLQDLLQNDDLARALFGEKFENFKTSTFPLLIKILNSEDALSVQVHPDDLYALKYENQLGKNEMWYILESQSEKSPNLVYGFNQKIDAEKLKSIIDNGKLDEVLNKITAKQNQVFYVPTGTVHAIGEGLLLAEVQQSSDVTYRLHDWNRVDKDGNARALHINQALDVIDYTQESYNYKNLSTENEIFEPLLAAETKQTLITCRNFVVEILCVSNALEVNKTGEFYLLTCIEGEFEVISISNNMPLTFGETLLIPAEVDVLKIHGKGKLLKTYIP